MAKEEVTAKKNQKDGAMKLVPIILGAVVLEVVLAYFLVTKIIAPQMRAAVQQTPLEEEGVKKSRTIGKIYEIKDIIVNPAGTDGTRYLNTTVGLEVENDQLIAELESRMPQIRDSLIDILVGKTIEELDGVEDKRLLREEILTRINDILPETKNGKVAHVYLIDFVIQ
ncbi:MAG: flagellar basal body-associated FliL family protein [Candidatus Latescibacteria bacterium]|nr:flagellar basal body-associated FliL family protein [Candidatus Latescibacterota bacterium]OPX25845.1 MAG: hypothetical protein B1H02_00390 [Candidatus Latescibacteria bacterium 4484_107]